MNDTSAPPPLRPSTIQLRKRQCGANRIRRLCVSHWDKFTSRRWSSWRKRQMWVSVRSMLIIRKERIRSDRSERQMHVYQHDCCSVWTMLWNSCIILKGHRRVAGKSSQELGGLRIALQRPVSTRIGKEEKLTSSVCLQGEWWRSRIWRAQQSVTESQIGWEMRKLTCGCTISAS